MQPGITCIMYVRNHAATLPAALESILHLQARPASEIIIIDDASKDGSSTIIDEYAKDPRIKVLRYTSAIGKVQGMNVGLVSARHALVAITEPWTLSDSSRFEKQAAFLEKHPEVCVVASYTNRTAPAFRKVEWTSEVIKAALLFENPLNHVTAMARSQVFATQGNNYRHTFDNYMADHDLWIRLIGECEFALLPEELVDAPDDYRKYGSVRSAILATDFFVKHINRLLQYSPTSREVKMTVSLFMGFEAEKFGSADKFSAWFQKIRDLNRLKRVFDVQALDTVLAYEWTKLGIFISKRGLSQYIAYERASGHSYVSVLGKIISKSVRHLFKQA